MKKESESKARKAFAKFIKLGTIVEKIDFVDQNKMPEAGRLELLVGTFWDIFFCELKVPFHQKYRANKLKAKWESSRYRALAKLLCLMRKYDSTIKRLTPAKCWENYVFVIDHFPEHRERLMFVNTDEQVMFLFGFSASVDSGVVKNFALKHIELFKDALKSFD